jgi:hypothetical protein
MRKMMQRDLRRHFFKPMPRRVACVSITVAAFFSGGANDRLRANVEAWI